MCDSCMGINEATWTRREVKGEAHGVCTPREGGGEGDDEIKPDFSPIRLWSLLQSTTVKCFSGMGSGDDKRWYGDADVVCMDGRRTVPWSRGATVDPLELRDMNER